MLKKIRSTKILKNIFENIKKNNINNYYIIELIF